MGRVMGQFTSMNSEQMQSIQGNNPGELDQHRAAVLSWLELQLLLCILPLSFWLFEEAALNNQH